MDVHNPAGFWIRLGAALLDGLVIGIPLSILSFVITGDIDNSSGDGWINLLSALYGIFLPVYWRGYVVGKKVCGIRIVKIDGEDVRIGTMVIRVLCGAFIYAITLGIAAIVSGIMVGIREDKRSIHDLIAGTYVTYNRPGE
ncbi:RDD family protein [Priestia koreensis]|uniref:RDD family protein n=1 Tax=Priestia koreensis TaxID=284581 RepID=UPI00203B3509|nr:RDD family protein [Priestia koreensis]MCM3003343.1 RDD family protein [Priestia koreensis]